MTTNAFLLATGAPADQCRPGGCAGLCTEVGLADAVRLYRGRLVARARLIVVDPDLAQEAVQDAFLRAWRACATFDPEGGPLLHWLLAITRNAAVDLARARARRLPVVPESSGREVGGGPDFAEVTAVRAELHSALLRIPPLHRTAIVETILRDRAPRDVAAEFGIPDATLRTRLHYGLRRLRQVLETADAA
jgi:RNA polymerase sigma-70 factor, ECF subfamily